jgi:hypothetical protein
VKELNKENFLVNFVAKDMLKERDVGDEVLNETF